MVAKLAVVIHAEEEFDWNDGFKSTNQSVTHHQELVRFVDELLAVGAKVTLAMDFPFISSQGGMAVVEKYRELADSKVEFATHLHPWVNPPFEEPFINNEVASVYSYPGNLPKDLEYKKLEVLTNKIESVSGVRPVTYLAGRYGTGGNTAQHLSELGYKVDLSISAYYDFSEQEGPDFSSYGNAVFSRDNIVYIPHTGSIISPINWLENKMNRNPKVYKKLETKLLTKMFKKMFYIRRLRLSPEGLSLRQLKLITKSQLSIGQQIFVLSFHSPSTKLDLTPYVDSKLRLDNLKKTVLNYIEWFNGFSDSQMFLPKQILQEGVSNDNS